jgi:hypothetical protein
MDMVKPLSSEACEYADLVHKCAGRASWVRAYAVLARNDATLARDSARKARRAGWTR